MEQKLNDNEHCSDSYLSRLIEGLKDPYYKTEPIRKYHGSVSYSFDTINGVSVSEINNKHLFIFSREDIFGVTDRLYLKGTQIPFEIITKKERKYYLYPNSALFTTIAVAGWRYSRAVSMIGNPYYYALKYPVSVLRIIYEYYWLINRQRPLDWICKREECDRCEMTDGQIEKWWTILTWTEWASSQTSTFKHFKYSDYIKQKIMK